MSKLKKIFLIVIIVVIGLFFAILLSDKIFLEPKPAVNVNINQQTSTNQQLSSKVKELASVPLNERTPLEQQLYGVARNFAERFSSFSTDSNFANLEEVKIFSSPKMIEELDRIINSNQQGQEFYGVSSKVLKIDLEEGQNTAKAKVSLQRQESKPGKENFVFYQNLELFLIKSGDNWLVDEAKWQS
jgi:hypothetical protein